MCFPFAFFVGPRILFLCLCCLHGSSVPEAPNALRYGLLDLCLSLGCRLMGASACPPLLTPHWFTLLCLSARFDPTLLPGFTQRTGVYSCRKQSLGQLVFLTKFMKVLLPALHLIYRELDIAAFLLFAHISTSCI